MSPTILIVGGAATGRVPMTAALLARLLNQRGLNWPVCSGGVVAHDDDPAEIEARDAMLTLGLDIAAYRAQPITDGAIAESAAIVAVDSGTARVIRARYPDTASRLTTLGELSGRARDIPDPFRMQVGAWITYAREIETLLKAGLPRLIAMLEGSDQESARESDTPHTQTNDPRRAGIERCETLLRQIHQGGNGASWSQTRQQLADAISEVSTQPIGDDDLAVAYAALLKAMLNFTFSTPTPGQIAFLSKSFERLRTPIDQTAISQLSTQMGTWAML